jgi:signal transduction histidine kinase
MNQLINKLLLFGCCLFAFLLFDSSVYQVVPVIAVVCLSALGSILEKTGYRAAVSAVFAVLCLLVPEFLYFTPLICYEVLWEKTAWSGLLVLPPLVSGFSGLPLISLALTLTLSVCAAAIKYYAVRLEKLKNGYNRLRDDTKELSFALEEKNKELIDKQDYEVHLATLHERNRIAREIHDSVGHIMSSSILQAGALIATATDKNTRENLTVLKNTLSEGMDSIRSSVHDLHADSVDLYAQLSALCKAFAFCPLAFDYDAEHMPSVKTVYAILSIVKEALSNIIRHSNATAAALTFKELPGFYQLVISDNGSNKVSRSENGMGIVNITARVENLSGHINIDNNRGFRLFITFPKKTD